MWKKRLFKRFLGYYVAERSMTSARGLFIFIINVHGFVGAPISKQFFTGSRSTALSKTRFLRPIQFGFLSFGSPSVRL